MARKRKIRGKSSQPELREPRREDAKLRINTFEDVADSEDEFHINRDKILLDENPHQKKRRKLQEQDEFLELSDEEVLAASATSDFSEDPDSNVEGNEGIRKSTKTGTISLESDGEGEIQPEEDAELGDWGSSKKDYYNADAIETEADALEEEKEARLLQQKRLEKLTEADFGFDPLEWADADLRGGDDDSENGVFEEILPQVEVPDDMAPAEKMKILKAKYPEFEPLARDFMDLQSVHEKLGLQAKAIEPSLKQDDILGTFTNRDNYDESENSKLPISVLKYNSLTAYLAALSMYLALFTSLANDSSAEAMAMPPLELRNHEVMEILLRSRTLWERVKDLHTPESDVAAPSVRQNYLEKPKPEKEPVPSESELKQREDHIATRPKNSRKSRAQRAAEAAQIESANRRAERIRRTEEGLAGINELIPGPMKAAPASTISRVQDDDDSDIGEQTSLTPQEAAEKAKRKKSLRFYTSQIAQKANKRDAAGRDAGGDADLPHRERLRDRQARLNVEAEGRGKKKGNSTADQFGGESDEEDRKAAREVRDLDGSSENEYYDLVATASRKKKAEKKARAQAEAAAAREGGSVVHAVEEVGADGKRAITYAIEKNKGLAPKRKKDVRNPRVKKRKKYEDKKKKLGSIRPVWKGGEGRGGYGGELTGIKKSLVKSIKL